MKRWWIAAAVVLGVGLLGGIGYAGFASNRPAVETPESKPNTVAAERCNVEQSASAPGKAVLTRKEVVQMPADGQLAEILTFAGQKVAQGQLLARLADVEKYQAALATAELALIEAQRALQEVREQAPLKTAEAHQRLLDAQKQLQLAESRRLSKAYAHASQETIDIAKANTMLAKIALDKAEENWRRNGGRADDDPEKATALSQLATARQAYYRSKANQEWLEQGPTDLEISQADNAIALAQAELNAAQEAWERVKDGPYELLLQQGDARVTQAEANLEHAQAVLEKVEIRAPFSGVVVSVDVQAGENLAAGKPLFSLIDPAALEVETIVTEEDLPYLREGMPASLYFDALPDAIVTGKVKSIIPLRLAGDSPRYTVRIALDGLPAGLADGMSADASIVLAQREDVLCLPRGLVRASGDGKAVVQVWNGSAAEKRTIQVGLRGDSNVEVLSGIQEGEEVVVK